MGHGHCLLPGRDRTTAWLILGLAACVFRHAPAQESTADAGRLIDPVVNVLSRVRGGVFRLDAGLSQGTAFYLDTLGGILVTNDHALHDGRDLSVTIDSVTSVPAQIVVRDQVADVAMLRVNAARCAHCTGLRLATAAPLTGERVAVIGHPRGHGLTVTTGMVASVERTAILADVNAGPGNSGSPLLNLTGEVIGVVTFSDEADRGGQLTGAVSVSSILALLPYARAVLDTLGDPPADLLPIAPPGSFPARVLAVVADTASVQVWDSLIGLDLGPFTVSFATPLTHFVNLRAAERALESSIGRDRQRRERRAQVPAPARYSEASVYRDWEQYVGSVTAPVVGISVQPKVGETVGSTIGKILAVAATGIAGAVVGTSPIVPVMPTTLRFHGDLQNVKLWRNQQVVSPVRGGRQLIRRLEAAPMFDFRDVAYGAYYVFHPGVFAPDSSGIPPDIYVTVDDLARPATLHQLELSAEMTATIWNSFEPYFREVLPDSDFRRANPTARWFAVIGRGYYYRSSCMEYSGKLAAGAIVRFSTRAEAESARYRLAPGDGCDIGAPR